MSKRSAREARIFIKKTVKEISEEYKNNDKVNAALLWDTMKMKIRSSSFH